jgi:opacity protein-like surface antigen
VVTLLAAAGPVLQGFPAAAEERAAGPYLSLEAGPNWMMTTHGRSGRDEGTVEFDTGARFHTALGYNLNRYAGLEFSTGAFANTVRGTDYSLTGVPVLLGGTFRYPNPSRLEPYVGGGVGFAFSILGFDDGCCYSYDTDVVLAWQGQAGLRYRFNDAMALGLGYQYTGMAGSDYTLFGVQTRLDTVHSHSAVLHFTVRF